MSEKSAKLKIRVPYRYLNFFAEYFQITGLDRKGAMIDMISSTMIMYIEELDSEDRISLVEKYQLEDIYTLPDIVRRKVFEEKCEKIRAKIISNGIKSLKKREKKEFGMMCIHQVTENQIIKILHDPKKHN